MRHGRQLLSVLVATVIVTLTSSSTASGVGDSEGVPGSAGTAPSAPEQSEPLPEPAPPTPDPAPAGEDHVDVEPVVELDRRQPRPTPALGDLASAVGTDDCTPIAPTAWHGAPETAGVRGEATDGFECYAFTTGESGAHALRLVVKEQGWTPLVTVYESDGDFAWNGYFYGDSFPVLALKGAMTYRIEVSGSTGPVPGDYRIGIYDVLGDTGSCDALTSLGWDAAAVEVDVARGAIDCREFTAPVGRTVRLDSFPGSDGQTHHKVVNSAGAVVCATDGYYTPARCDLAGAGPYRLLSSLNYAGNDAAARVSVIDTESDAGCVTLPPAEWGAPLPTSAMRRSDGSGLECFVFTSPHAGRYAVRSRFASSQWTARTELWEAGSGDRLLHDHGHHDFAEVLLREARSYRFVVSGDPDGWARAYALGIFDITQQHGCGSIPSLHWDASPWQTDLQDGTVDCAAITAPAGTSLRLQAQLESPEGQVVTSIYNAAGERVCDVRTDQIQPCTLTGAGPYRVIGRGDEDTAAVAHRLFVNDVASDRGCTPVPLATWDAELPGAGTRQPDGSGAECYTVTTAGAGSYVLRPWFESTQWNARVELWESTASLVWDGSYSHYLHYYLNQVSLKSASGYRVVVTGDPDGYDRGYRFGLFDLKGATGCVNVTDLAWDAPALPGTSTQGALDCREISAPAGSNVRIRLERSGELGSPIATVVNRAGTVLCEMSGGQSGRCELSGSGPFRMVVRDGDARDEVAYSAWVNDPAQTDGCTLAGSVLDMDSPALSGTLVGRATSACLALDLATGSHVFAALRGADVRAVLINGRGDEVCATGDEGPGLSCQLSGPGPFKVLLTNRAPTPADYRLLLRRPSPAPTCTAIPSVAYGFDQLTGKLPENLDNRCYTFDATNGDQLTFEHVGLETNQRPDLFVFKPSGDLLCQGTYRWWWAPEVGCTATSTGKHVVMLVADENSAGRYGLSAQCGNPACGPDELTVLGATPRLLGQSPSVTVTLQGKNFDMSQSVALYRSATELVGKMSSVGEDRRTARALFDLSTAGLGTWNVRVTGADGTTATYPDAVTVTGAGEPEISAQLTGLGRFVPGRSQTLSVSLANTGNVDGIGVPLIIDGLPAGSVIEPQFEVHELDAEGNASTATIDPDLDVFTREDGTMGLPLLINRMPAGGKVDVSFKITVAAATDFAVKADVGQCWANQLTDAPRGKGLAGSAASAGRDCFSGAINLMVDTAMENVPGAACYSLARDVVQTGITNWADNGSPFEFGGLGDVISFGLSTGLSAFECGAEFFPPAKALTTAVKFASVAGKVLSYGETGANCFEFGTELGYMMVNSLDPNEMVGPSGGGAQNAIRGEGAQRYAVYFENSEEATAPAQVVTIDSDLDADLFDMSTLTFGGVAFGTTSWAPGESVESLDHTLDLVSDEGLQLHIAASKTDDGTLAWELTTIDPATGEIPEDPFLGFLPPNHNGTEGQGVLYFDVAYAPEVQSGDVVPAQASIVFDLNPPILTNTWSNLIDRTTPTATVAPLPAGTGDVSFPVSWSSADATSDVTEVRIYQAVDGGDYRLWHTGEPTGTAVFTGERGHQYAFSAVSRDGAGNLSAIPSVPHATTEVLLGTVQFTSAPELSGESRVGDELSVTPGNTAPADATRQYRWTRDGEVIHGSAGQSYTVTPEDVGHVIGAVVTAQRAQWADGVATVEGTPVLPGTIRYDGARLKVLGTPKVGKKVTVKLATDSLYPTTGTVTYQWYRGKSKIAKATKAAYTIAKKDRGMKLACWATITVPGYQPLVLKTKPVAVG